MKEIPAGVSLAQVVDNFLPKGHFEDLEQATDATIEVLQKAKYDGFLTVMFDDEGSITLGETGLTPGAEFTQKDKERTLNIATAGAKFLASVPLGISLDMLGNVYMEKGDMRSAMILLTLGKTLAEKFGSGEDDNDDPN